MRLKDAIKEWELTHAGNIIAVIVGTRGASVCGQLNRIASDRMGKDVGYTAQKIKEFKDQVSLWKITKSTNP